MTRILLAAAFAALALAGSARAQGNPPPVYMPAGLDSARAWGLRAKVMLEESRSDTVGPNEGRAFDLLHRIARQYFERLGPQGMRGAAGVLALYDSLKLGVQFAQDEELPQFCALSYFNPAYQGYATLTYLYWWRGDELKFQPIALRGGQKLELEVWWTGNELGPYEMGLVDYKRTGETRDGYLTMLRLSRNADFWGRIPVKAPSMPLEGPGPSRFVDLNHDATPELVHWAESPPDPRFVADRNLPPIISEHVYQRAEDGFTRLERRTLGSPFATWVLFLRALENGQTALAQSLASTPEIYRRAVALKLGAVTAKGSWRTVELPQGGRWNDWMRFQYGTPGTFEHGLEVRLTETEGHWLISKLESLDAPAPAPKSSAKKSGSTTGKKS